jgi:hypothetical protein
MKKLTILITMLALTFKINAQIPTDNIIVKSTVSSDFTYNDCNFTDTNTEIEFTKYSPNSKITILVNSDTLYKKLPLGISSNNYVEPGLPREAVSYNIIYNPPSYYTLIYINDITIKKLQVIFTKTNVYPTDTTYTSNYIFNGLINSNQDVQVTTTNIITSPSPFTDNLSIQTNEETDFQIFNLNGQKVKDGHIHEATTIQTDELTPGMYFLKTKNGTTKIIKR